MEKSYPMAVIKVPGKVEFQERKWREPLANEVLIKVKAVSICGSDLHIFKGRHPAAPLPVTIGHEFSGEVIQTGGGVSRVKEGDRVVVEPVIVCGECYFCLRGTYNLCTSLSFEYRQGQGAFTPYFVMDEHWVHKLPEGISFEEGALIEPLAVALHAVKKADIELGQTVAIFGAGPIGLLILLLIKRSGVGEIFVVDVQGHRLKKAEAFGGFEVLNNSKEDSVTRILEMTSQMGVDQSFEAVGLEETLVQSLQVLKKGGMSVIVGLLEDLEARIPANIFIQKEISLIGSQGYCWDFQTALKLVERGDIELKDIISHVLPLSSLQEGFELLLDPAKKAVKVVVKMA
jgi:2-desacetyl-2-hydroxyethyl bacteriochlorophyllide A dehydrogenase